MSSALPKMRWPKRDLPLRLRQDLQPRDDEGSIRSRLIVADELTGQFARVSKRVWQSLVEGTADTTSWRLAHAANWTTSRQGVGRSSPRHWNPLFIRIPLIAIDRVAGILALHSGLLFSKAAVSFWLMFMTVTVAMLCSQTFAMTIAFSNLPQFFRETNPVLLGMIIAGTKLAHELSHATMCRRQGARCGSLGVILMCGMPCPYCDVTDSYRLSNASNRVAVMTAGIYTEWIIASLAAWCFLFAGSMSGQLHALNVMIVCGVSTLLFNANPLMRYDGYYVLSDWIGSVNLRQESKLAFMRVLSGERQSLPKREKLLASYHVLSTGYRLLVLFAIGMFLIHLLQWMQLPWIGKIVVTTMGVLMVRQFASRMYQMMSGTGHWIGFPRGRRALLSISIIGLLGLVVLVPLPRRASVHGYLDAAGAKDVHLGASGIISKVHCDYGNVVSVGQPLVQIEDSQTALHQIKWRHEVRLASLRSRMIRQDSIETDSFAMRSGDEIDPMSRWKTMEAAEASARDNLATAIKRSERSISLAPVRGVVVPAKPTGLERSLDPFSLRSRTGQSSDPGQSWCRISPGFEMAAVLEVDAIHRRSLDIGSEVRIMLGAAGNGRIVLAQVQSISTITPTPDSFDQDARFEISCSLPHMKSNSVTTGEQNKIAVPPEIESRNLIAKLGQSCHGTIELPRQSIAQAGLQRLEAWLE